MRLHVTRLLTVALPIGLIASVAHADRLSPNVLNNPGFEQGVANCFVLNQGDWKSNNKTSPLAGTNSMTVGMAGNYHRVSCSTGVGNYFPFGKSVNVKATVRADLASASTLNLCAVAVYDDWSRASWCVAANKTVGNVATISTAVNLNASKRLRAIGLDFVSTGSNSIRYTVDNGSLQVNVPDSAPPPQPPPPPPPPPPSTSKWVSGYYVGYQRDLYPPSAIDFSGLTHLVVGRVTPNTDGSLNTTFDVDAVEGPKMAKDLTTRAHAAGKKTILMLGGAGANGWASATTPANRARFVNNLVQFARNYGFDGFDLDWEPFDPPNFPAFKSLVQELRAAFPGVILTFPVGWVNANFPTVDPFYAEIAPLIDQMNIMSYQMSDNWGGWQTWHSSAIYDHAQLRPTSIDVSIQNYVAAGVPASKLGMGIGFYGSCWGSPITGPRQSSGSASVKASDNTMSYTNIMNQYYSASNYYWDSAAQASYLSFTSPRGPAGCTYISYEDERSIAAKGTYAKQKGVGGTIVWTINQGYRPGASSPNAMMQALRQAFLQ